MTVPVLPRVHGGPGADGPARWDFSSNGNATGPCPTALAAVLAADPRHYPDAGHQAVREALAALHGVAPQRVLVAASASEFIQRVTAVTHRLWPGSVAVPPLAYGDYALAACAHGRRLWCEGDAVPATLRWWAEPSSPLGQDAPPPQRPGAVPTVLDSVYAPLRLDGAPTWSAADRDAVFTLHSPGKALGLVGVRAAYAIAPRAADWPVDAAVAALQAAAPSWPLGTQGEALLQAWATPAAQQWLAQSLPQLAAWRAQLRAALAARGVALQPSVAPFFAARVSLPSGLLRHHGVAVRDAASFGLPGWVRLAAQPPAGQQALLAALGAAAVVAATDPSDWADTPCGPALHPIQETPFP